MDGQYTEIQDDEKVEGGRRYTPEQVATTHTLRASPVRELDDRIRHRQHIC